MCLSVCVLLSKETKRMLQVVLIERRTTKNEIETKYKRQDITSRFNF